MAVSMTDFFMSSPHPRYCSCKTRACTFSIPLLSGYKSALLPATVVLERGPAKPSQALLGIISSKPCPFYTLKSLAFQDPCRNFSPDTNKGRRLLNITDEKCEAILRQKEMRLGVQMAVPFDDVVICF